MNGLRCIWTVRAGILPGVVMPELTRTWLIAADAWGKLDDQGRLELFHRHRSEAHQYAVDITDPNRVNWVNVDFMWM